MINHSTMNIILRHLVCIFKHESTFTIKSEQLVILPFQSAIL